MRIYINYIYIYIICVYGRPCPLEAATKAVELLQAQLGNAFGGTPGSNARCLSIHTRTQLRRSLLVRVSVSNPSQAPAQVICFSYLWWPMGDRSLQEFLHQCRQSQVNCVPLTRGGGRAHHDPLNLSLYFTVKRARMEQAMGCSVRAMVDHQPPHLPL